jgi:hypothetical protein
MFSHCHGLLDIFIIEGVIMVMAPSPGTIKMKRLWSQITCKFSVAIKDVNMIAIKDINMIAIKDVNMIAIKDVNMIAIKDVNSVLLTILPPQSTKLV